jgi:hypothetical protein
MGLKASEESETRPAPSVFLKRNIAGGRPYTSLPTAIPLYSHPFLRVDKRNAKQMTNRSSLSLSQNKSKTILIYIYIYINYTFLIHTFDILLIKPTFKFT